MISKDTPVIILCGGKGTRIADVTTSVPKPMVQIGGKPILWHIMKIYASYGFKNFILTLGHKGWEIKNYFLNYRKMTSDFRIDFGEAGHPVSFLNNEEGLDWSITFAETGEETQTGQRIALCRKYVDTPYFMCTYGDGVGDVRIDKLIDRSLEQDKIGTVTAVRPSGRFGNIEFGEDGIVSSFNEKPDAGGGIINGGFFVFKKSFFEVLDKYGDVMLERQPMDDLVGNRELCTFTHEGFWEPMDTSREYRMLNNLWDEGKAVWKTW